MICQNIKAVFLAVGPTIVIRCFIFIFSPDSMKPNDCKLVFLDVKSAFKKLLLLEIQLVGGGCSEWK
jgi:hypothetical protein